MPSTSDLSAIIHYYIVKNKTAFIDLKEFFIFTKKYAERNVEENSDLVKYLGNSTTTITDELQALEAKHLIALVKKGGSQIIISIPFFTNHYTKQYSKILINETVPFPTVEDLPKNFPEDAIEKKEAAKYISQNLNRESENSHSLYILVFGKNIPSLLLPSKISVNTLIELAQKKIKHILKKEQYHDYFLKKLRSTNATKELSVKNFYTHFVDDPNFKYKDITDDNDYYICNQLLYYIRQDFEKIPDRTPEDTNVLQSAKILEIQTTFMKEKLQQEIKRQEALKELEQSLNQPPYYFSIQQILKFQDKNGRLLYGRYSENDLKDFLQERTTDGKTNELPSLLIFKVSTGTRYYVYKRNINQIVIRLCNEANATIGRLIEDKWNKLLLNFQQIPEMTNAASFEELLHKLVEENSPILHSLLNANFMNLLALETRNNDNPSINIFENQQLRSYSDLLMLYNNKILTNAKKQMPFYYSIPIISWFIKLITGKNAKPRKPEKTNKTRTESSSSRRTNNVSVSSQEEIASKAEAITKELVPAGSTIDKELNSLIKEWNKMLAKDAYKNLVEDVNSLIRDYTRKVVRTLSAKSFSKDRIENLAKTLVETPNMRKVSEDKALFDYVVLYMLRLIKNIKK